MGVTPAPLQNASHTSRGAVSVGDQVLPPGARTFDSDFEFSFDAGEGITASVHGAPLQVGYAEGDNISTANGLFPLVFSIDDGTHPVWNQQDGYLVQKHVASFGTLNFFLGFAQKEWDEDPLPRLLASAVGAETGDGSFSFGWDIFESSTAEFSFTAFGHSGGQSRVYSDEGDLYVVTDGDIRLNPTGSVLVNGSPLGSYVDLTTAQTIGGAKRSVVTEIFSDGGGTLSMNMADSNDFKHLTTEDTLLDNPVNVVAGQSGVITVTQGSTPRVLTFGSYWKSIGGVAGTLTNTAGAVDIITYVVVSSSFIFYSIAQDVK